jgi:hypothetical protein
MLSGDEFKLAFMRSLNGGLGQALPHPLLKGAFFYTSSSATREQTFNNTL